jgi:CBS domain containing-hemolysin-like protein
MTQSTIKTFAILYLIVGTIQFLGCIVRLILPYERNADYKRKLKIYLLISIVFLLTFMLVILTDYNPEETFWEYPLNIYFSIVPVLLSIFYLRTIYGPKVAVK